MKKLTLNDSGLILNEIKEANSILLHCHTSADGDSVGSALGLRHILAGMKNTDGSQKKVTVIQSDTPVPHYLSFLPGFELIQSIHFHDLNLADFDLFIILDSAGPDKISTLKPIQFPLSIKTICIDHHNSNVGYADLNLIVPDYPATCQILAGLARSWNATEPLAVPFPSESALCFFIGMYTDTGGFKYPGTSAKTFELASFLAEKAPNFTDALFILENSYKKDQMWAKRIFLNSLETWFDDQVAVASATHEQLLAAKVNPMEANGSDMAVMLKSTIGWDIGVAMVEQKPGVFKVSFRSRDGNTFDLSKMIVTLGGGGHKAAAGVGVSGTLEEAKKKIKDALAASFPILQN